MNFNRSAALILCLTILYYHVISMTSNKLNGPSELFQNMHILVEPDVYIFYWSLNDTDALFEVHVKGIYFYINLFLNS